MAKITPFLWFNDQAEEAAKFYASIFKGSRIETVTRFPEGARGAAGGVMTVGFIIAGQKFVALNGGPLFKFTEAVSFVVNCDSQEEIDFYWRKLSKGGELGQCGWLKDKNGLSWQIVPSNLPKLLDTSKPEKSQRVMMAIMKMKKLDISKLQKAFDA